MYFWFLKSVNYTSCMCLPERCFFNPTYMENITYFSNMVLFRVVRLLLFILIGRAGTVQPFLACKILCNDTNKNPSRNYYEFCMFFLAYTSILCIILYMLPFRNVINKPYISDDTPCVS